MKKEKVVEKLNKFLKKNNYAIVQVVDNETVASVERKGFIAEFEEFLNVKPSWDMQVIGSEEYHEVKYENGLYSCSCGLFQHRNVRPCHHIKIAILKWHYARNTNMFKFPGAYPTTEDRYLADIVERNVPIKNITLYSEETSMNTKFDLIFKHSNLRNGFEWINDVPCVEVE